MLVRGLGRWSAALLAVGIILSASSTVWAQSNNNNNNNNNSDSGSSSSAAAGVIVDADGVLRTKAFSDPGGNLMRERIQSAKSTLDPKVRSYSKLRKISLNRLEQAIIERQGVMTDDMRFMAGLLRVKYVFYYPDSKDIVLAGPAEGWVPDVSGRTVGMSTGRPVVQLQDVVVALRTFPAGNPTSPMIGCSIDPTPEGLAAMQQYLKSNRPNPNEPQPFVEGLKNSLGYQLVSINGVSPKTHFAQVMVEADYRMKLIGIGLERPPVKLISYVERAKPSDVARSAMQRWFFMPDYQCVRESDDRLAMELVGDGVKLVGEDEVVMASGERRQAAGRGNRASHDFVVNFTRRYPELAERSPVYAELRNLIDLAVAAAYIQQQGYCEKAGWKMDFFGNEKAYSVETYSIPKTVESAVNAIWKGHTLMTPIGGGVDLQPTKAFESDNLLPDEKGKVSKLHQSIKPNLAPGQWWWD